MLVVVAGVLAALLISFFIWKLSVCYHISYNADYCYAHLIW